MISSLPFLFWRGEKMGKVLMGNRGTGKEIVLLI